MGKKRPRSLTGPEIVSTYLCDAHFNGRLLPQSGSAASSGGAGHGPLRFDSAKEYFAYMQRIMLEEARAEVAEALTAAEKRRQPPRLLRLQQSQRPGGRRLASLEFCAEAAPASGGKDQLRPGAVFLLQPRVGAPID